MTTADVVIVGAGPVGLDMACRLALGGASVVVIERRTNPNPWSRSIGIHPPALESLADIGVIDQLREAGLEIRRGRAIAGGRPVGTMTFESCPPPFRFVLALPQSQTEAILENRLLQLAPDALHRGAVVTAVVSTGTGAIVDTVSGERYQGRILVGADGTYSQVRRSLGIHFAGGPYDDTFAMGDFADTDSGLGQDAAIFLTRGGLVEAFPLPGGLRRWVVRTDAFMESPTPKQIAEVVTQRTGHVLDTDSSGFTSGFRVHRFLADTLVRGPVLLAGDAGHVVSPIGGQGMNLGWLASRHAALAILAALADPARRSTLFDNYSRTCRARAKRVARRAEFNMSFGRPGRFHIARAAARLLLIPPLRGVFARRFTMRGLT